MAAPIRIPESHDEPVASMLQILQLREPAPQAPAIASERPAAPASLDEPQIFEARSLPQIRRIYGGEIGAQALLAAGATVPEGRLPHSVHLYFVRGGKSELSTTLQVRTSLEGRSFSNRQVTCVQEGKPILQLNASFKKAEPALEWNPPAPTVEGPDHLPSSLRLFRAVEHPMARLIGDNAAFDVRHVEGNIYLEPDPKRRPLQHVWMRPRQVILADPATNQMLHRALLLYSIDQLMLEPALRVLGLCWLSRGMSMASLDHAMWFKGDVDVNQWLLFQGECDFAADGRAKAHVNVFDPQGNFLASATQEGMIRIPRDGHSGSETWSFGEPLREQTGRK